MPRPTLFLRFTGHLLRLIGYGSDDPVGRSTRLAVVQLWAETAGERRLRTPDAA